MNVVQHLRNSSTIRSHLGWKLLEPIAFVDSRDHPAIQLADVIAGPAAVLFADGPHSILPDFDIIDPANRSAAVNALIL